MASQAKGKEQPRKNFPNTFFFSNTIQTFFAFSFVQEKQAAATREMQWREAKRESGREIKRGRDSN